MEYSDDSDSVEPGADLTLDGSDLGRASYDADSDGVADSVVIGDGQYTVVATDSDGDGEIDDVTGYDSDGNELPGGELGMPDPGAGTGPSDGSDAEPPTGSDGTDGSIDTVASGDNAAGTDSADSADSTASAASTERTASTGGSDTDGTGSTDGSTASDAPSLSVIDDQGRSVDLGTAQVDMDGDGTPDTTVVRGDDGSTVGYTDRNGDGEVDQITRVEADNSVIITVADGNGDWSVVATGRLDDDGNFVPADSEQGTTDTGSSAATDSGVGYRQEIPANGAVAQPAADQPAADTSATADADTAGAATDSGATATGAADTAAAASDASDGSDAEAADAAVGAVPAGASSSGEQGFEDAADGGASAAGDIDGTGDADLVYTDQSGQVYQLGAPTADFDGDGTNDTVVTTLANGTVVGYSDIDGDGHIDQVTQIDPDGSVTVGVPDGDGGWEQAATGTIGPEGQFVASTAPAGTGRTDGSH